MRIILFFIVFLLPFIPSARISFTMVRAFPRDVFYYRSGAHMRQALLKTNGKEWFIKHIIRSNYSGLLLLNFIEGDYCMVRNYVTEEIKPEVDDYISGVKKTLNYLSEVNDTIYCIYAPPYPTRDPKFKADPPIFRSRPIDKTKWNYNLDGFVFQTYVKYLAIGIEIFPHQALTNLEIRYKVFSMDKEIYFMAKNSIGSPENPSIEDAEKLYEAIIKMDEYILSVPIPEKRRKMISWSYTAGKHSCPNPSIKDLILRIKKQ